jgi:uncharacterized membrane protein
MSALDAPDTEREDSVDKRVLIASALATAVVGPALLSAQKPAETPSFKAEKCYGIAKAGKNDCASTGNNSCGWPNEALEAVRPGLESDTPENARAV